MNLTRRHDSKMKSCDSGSIPFTSNLRKYLDGARSYGQVSNEATEFFEQNVISVFVDKAKAGIEVPNYPQFRDMTEMFFDMMTGISKVNGGYVETTPLTIQNGRGAIPEVSAIKDLSNFISEKLGASFNIRICITGPYTLASRFAYKDKGTFTRLGDALARVIETNIFKNKHGAVQLVSIDEPVFGLVDDPLLDYGSEGRENLLKTWESLTQRIKAKGARSILHLHTARDELFWKVNALDIVESHVDDPFYHAKGTKERLEATDKFTKASIAITDFDQLIRNKITAESSLKLSETSINEKIAETWTLINKQQVDPISFIEDPNLMGKRLSRILELFGESRVPYAGPECGLKSFPTYKSALECLRRVEKAVKETKG
jgi:5-methyltetrahydropteroyltriglutamate--homocysteine methyltransferase